MHPDPYLRHAASTDALALARLRAASFRELGLIAPNDSAAFAREAAAEMRELFEVDRLAGWVLVAGGRIAGSACVLFWQRLPYADSSLHAELAGVYVEPFYRRRGFARELCREAIALAWARGPRRIVVHPSAAGRALYESFGFAGAEEMRLDRAC